MLGNKVGLNDAINDATFSAVHSLQKNSAKFGQEGSGFMLVDLDEARELGIMPIPYVKGLKQSPNSLLWWDDRTRGGLGMVS
jgi:hypothetical protein